MTAPRGAPARDEDDVEWFGWFRPLYFMLGIILGGLTDSCTREHDALDSLKRIEKRLDALAPRQGSR